MNMNVTSRNLLIIIFGFILLSQAVYTYQNMNMFQTQYDRQTQEKMRELGQIVQEQFAPAIKYNIPLDRLSRVNHLLQTIVDDTPDLAFIDVVANGQTLYSANRSREALDVLTVSVSDESNRQVAEIRLGIGGDAKKHTARILFDLFTIVFVGLIVTYELLKFFSSRMLHIPGQETLIAANCLMDSLQTFRMKINSHELSLFLTEITEVITTIRQRMDQLGRDLKALSDSVARTTLAGKEKVLALIGAQQRTLADLAKENVRFSRIIDPAHVRPMVFLFVLSANLHSSFLPFFAKELSQSPNFLTAHVSEKMLMGLPISAYMITVTITMLILGTGWCSRIRPFRAVAFGLAVTAVGLVLCGLSKTIVSLIVARMFCAVGFAVIVLYGRQHIVDHAKPENRAFHLAGYTSAFSGGMFCSIIIGGIMADYFSYPTVFYGAAALLTFVFLFAHMVFENDGGETQKSDAAEPELKRFILAGIRDRALLAVMFHGILTRILLIGFYYYSLPIFLKVEFNYADIGRIMMFYGLTSILLASFMNKYIKKAAQSKTAIVVSNIAFGLTVLAFNFVQTDGAWASALYSIAGLVVLGISNSLTFPSQVNLLLGTPTARQMGSRAPLAVYQSVERIGSALGPIVFGFMATHLPIAKTIGYGGLICIAGNLIFLLFYPSLKSIPHPAPAVEGHKPIQ